METVLKLPYAEKYIIEYPQKTKRRKHIEEYAKKSLFEIHPGFCEESLWDYKIVKNKDKRNLEIFVLDRDFYIQKRISDNKSDFYITDTSGKKIRFFERNRFDEKGCKKTHKSFVVGILAGLALLIIIVSLLQIAGYKKTPSVVEETVAVIFPEDALNVFDFINELSTTIDEHNGKISYISFNATGKGYLSYSVYGCEPYSLVRDLANTDYSAEIRCENVVYDNGKEKFELKIEIPLSSICQKTLDELSLLELQSRVSELLKESNVILISSGEDYGSGRISFNFECSGKELSDVNESLKQICIVNNLFPASFSEQPHSESNLFLIKIELISLEEIQKLAEGKNEEKLSVLFESGKINRLSSNDSDNKKSIDLTNSVKRWKKIGSVKKEGKTFYYYRTEEGKIEISEVNNE